MIAEIRGFEKGVGGRGLATNSAQNTAEKCPPELCLPTHKGGIGKGG